MSGIIFLGTNDLDGIRDYYINQVGMELWLEQADCIILRHGNLLLGFCQRGEVQKGGIITIFYPNAEDVDQRYEELRSGSDTGPGANQQDPPKRNPKYDIYHFFTQDPEGRTVEFQAFLHRTPTFIEGMELLATRRSIRRFTEAEVPESVLASIFESCRFSPTSCNSEPHYYIIIRDREVIDFLVSRRGSSSVPIGRSPFAVAICSDPGRTSRPEQDGCIAAYHFVLACWTHGVGTCWIADMDRDDVKERLGIPLSHYIATVTPVGYPARIPKAPPRMPASELVRTIG